MEKDFLSNIGMGGLDKGLLIFIIAILVLILLIWCIVTTSMLCKLKKRYERFSRGRDAKSLEKEIGAMFEENRVIREQTDKNKKDIRVIYKTLEKAIQKTGLVKYDAYGQMGGKMSFTLALLDENNDGLVMNSIHGTDGCYVYTKEIKGGKCSITLGAEEEEALNQAMDITSI